MVKNPPSNAGDMGSIPGWGTKLPPATGQLSPRATQPTKPCVPQLLSPHALEPTLRNRRSSCKGEKEPKLPLEAGLGRSWLSLGNTLSSKQSCKFFYCILMMRQTQSDSSEIPKSPSWTVTHRFKLRPACFQRGRK